MPDRIPIKILGTGGFVPERVVTNAELGATYDVSDEWILSRTGIRERRIAGDDENTLTLAREASLVALKDAGMTADDIDLIIVATSTPVTTLPSTACFLQHQLGCRPVPGFDLSAACSGFVYAFVTATHMMNSGGYRTALVVGSEKMSVVSNYEDRSSGVLLGDGAGAVILGPSPDDTSGIYYQDLGSDGEGAEFVWVPAGGSLMPASQRTLDEKLHFLKMNGREVYKFVVAKMQQVLDETLAAAGLTYADIALIVPHQSNLRMIESVMEKHSIPPEKMAVNIDRYGNTSAASVPLALAEAVRAGSVTSGDWVILAGFGAGMTWGSVLLRL